MEPYWTLPRVLVFWAKTHLDVTVWQLGEFHQHCSWPCLSIWTVETHMMCLYGLSATHKDSYLPCMYPCISDTSSVAECMAWHMLSVMKCLMQKLIATSLMEVYEHAWSRHGSEWGWNLFCWLARSSSSLPVLWLLSLYMPGCRL